MGDFDTTNQTEAQPVQQAPAPKPAKKKPKPAAKPKVAGMPTVAAFRCALGSMIVREHSTMDSLVAKVAADGVAFLVDGASYEPQAVVLSPEAYEALMAAAR